MTTVTREAAVTAGTTPQGSNTMPLVIVTILFFMWGLLTSLNDVLIPHLKAVYTLSYVQAMMVQFCFFSAYFVVSVPAGMLVRKIGYQNGAVAGLVIAASGCALFFPAATGGYAIFLLAFFVLAGGITILQVAANPYVTVLGDPQTASSRLTLTQAFNSLGTTVGPAVGGILIFSGAVVSAADLAKMPAVELAAHRAAEAAAVQMPYLGLAAALLALAVFFALAKLPRIVDEQLETASSAGGAPELLSHRHLLLGAIGIFLYVGGEVSIGSFLINFFGESHIGALPPAEAAKYVSFYWGGAMIGRFIGFAVMRKVSPGATLAFNAGMAILLIVIAATTSGKLAMWSIIAVGLCNSIMFPTIFSMALNKLGPQTSRGSGVLCMAIVGGALVPFAQGWLADTVGLQASFFLPAACYAFILFYGAKFADMYQTEQTA